MLVFCFHINQLSSPKDNSYLYGVSNNLDRNKNYNRIYLVLLGLFQLARIK